jgi:hypothetical protein
MGSNFVEDTARQGIATAKRKTLVNMTGYSGDAFAVPIINGSAEVWSPARGGPVDSIVRGWTRNTLYNLNNRLNGSGYSFFGSAGSGKFQGRDVSNLDYPYIQAPDWWLFAVDPANPNFTKTNSPTVITGLGYHFGDTVIQANTAASDFTNKLLLPSTSFTLPTVSGLSDNTVVNSYKRAGDITDKFYSAVSSFMTDTWQNANSIINSLNAAWDAFTARSVAQQQDEVARMQRMFTAANGFFNSNINRRVTEITAKFQQERNVTFREMYVQAYNTHKQVYMQAINALEQWRNVPLEDEISREKWVMEAVERRQRANLEMLHNRAGIATQAFQYASAEGKRFLFNSEQAFNGILNTEKALAEYMNVLANVGGNRGDSGNPYMQMLLGGVQLAGAVAGAIPTGGASLAAAPSAVGKLYQGAVN